MTNNEDTSGVTQDLPADLDLTLTYNPYIQSTVSIADGEKHVLEILPKSFLPKISINNNMEGPMADGDFLIEYEVGKGGIGRVDAAKQLCFDRMVAIKRVRSDRGSVHAEQQLEKEARIMGRLEHPAIPPVHLVGLDVEGQLSLVMKFIEGNSWHEILYRDCQKIDQQRLPQWYIEKHLNYFIRIGEALEFAHQKSIIHRDIKPSNVVIGDYGEVYLIDWGIAVELDKGTVLRDHKYAGTPCYASPEMVGGDPRWDIRSDVYLMGGLLFHVLTGGPPHSGETVADLFSKINNETTPQLSNSIPAGLREICSRAMEKDPQERYSSVYALLEDIRYFLTNGQMLKLLSKADDDLRKIEDMLNSGVSSSAEFDVIGARCRFRLEEINQNWPENSRVKSMLCKCLKFLIGDALDKKRLAAARALLKQYSDLADSESDIWIHKTNNQIENLAHQLVSRTDELGIGIQSMLVEELAAQKKAYDELLASYAKLQKRKD